MNDYTPAERLRIVVIGAVVPIVIAAVGIAVMLSWSADLPDPVAIHWNGSGEPDGFGSLAGLTLMIGGIAAGFGAIVTLATLFQSAGVYTRTLLGTSVWLSTLITVGVVGSVYMQRGLADARDVGDGAGVGFWLLAGAVGGLLLAVPAALLAPRAPLVAHDEAATPALGLAERERAVWSRSTAPQSWLFAVLFGGVFLLLGVATVSLAVSGEPYWSTLLIAVLLLLVAVGTSFWRVRVSSTGFAVRSLLGLPRFTVPIEQIESARVTQVSPLGDFGGWGVRWGSNGRIGVVVRSGEALEVSRTRGRTIVVTVEDAASAAALINGFRERTAAVGR
jgi:hypothetical protein